MLLTVESNFWQKMQNHEFVLILKEMKCLRRQQFLFFGPQFDKKARNIIVVSIWTCAWDLTFSWNNKLTLTNSWQSLAIIQTALLHPPTSIFNQLLAIYVSSIRITGMEEGLKFWRRGWAVLKGRLMQQVLLLFLPKYRIAIAPMGPYIRPACSCPWPAIHAPCSDGPSLIPTYI